MNDDRGPITRPGDDPPDSAPRTGPPTGPVVHATPEAMTSAPSHEPATEVPQPEQASSEDAGSSSVPGFLIEPVAISPTSIAPGEAQSVVAPSAALPIVLAIPEMASDTPVFVAVESMPYSALPAAASVLDMPTVAPTVAPAAAPRVIPAAVAPAVAAPPPPLPLRPVLTIPPPPPVELAPPLPRSLWPGRLRRAALILVSLAAGYVVLVLALIVAYRWVDPPRSALMIATHLSGEKVLYAPVPITSISSYLQRAVVTSEDARFCDHHGVDWGALYEAMGESRGGSTITMQTAKNLFLWNSRSYVRKAIEIPVALTIDAFWPKRRILEVYLNIAEWGPGIFGAEAASYYHFNKPASRLNAQEAALLAAALPNPIARDAGEPGRTTSVLASRLRGRMASSDYFVHCLDLRSLPRAEPRAPARPTVKPAARQTPEQRPAARAEPQFDPWQTKTEPAFNRWQNGAQN